MATAREIALDWTPTAVRRLMRAVVGRPGGFAGNYESWQAASRDATGYDDGAIVDRVLAASLAVRRGDALFERDSVLFHKPEPRYPLLAEMLAVGLQKGGRLSVLDFGGALGSLYYQHRSFLAA